MWKKSISPWMAIVGRFRLYTLIARRRSSTIVFLSCIWGIIATYPELTASPRPLCLRVTSTSDDQRSLDYSGTPAVVLCVDLRSILTLQNYYPYTLLPHRTILSACVLLDAPLDGSIPIEETACALHTGSSLWRSMRCERRAGRVGCGGGDGDKEGVSRMDRHRTLTRSCLSTHTAPFYGLR
ncbi:hypothetical protein C8R46DRAFT_292201 [Mycena filopes]|nr:hypothetical protein C8R46DRAFT_292201 [Mycena filopes]